jgi:valyl-tRNA synthetase
MEIPSKYEPQLAESKWYAYWLEKGFFNSTPDTRPAYTIVIPPPNVTGVLHMGHMLNNTIQDVLIRRARMRGFNACWVPGTDHASIATEAKVVQKLRAEGIKKSDLSREAFLDHAWEWTHKHGGIILEQLKKLGASCDWNRTRFTMDEKYYEAVIDTFIDLYNKGKIYRGERMINWDPAAKTALSDEEVIYKEVNSHLYHLKYQVVGSDEFIVVATTRPETILGDTAVCVNPKDERYKHLHGKQVIVPLVNRAVNIIADDYVDMEFGTGCLKVTPAHDMNDFMLGQKFNLEIINMMNDDGTISEAGGMYVGQDRFAVRKQIALDLEAAGLLIKQEQYANKVGYSERTDVVIEPRLSLQWFVDMKDLSKPALENVMNDNIKFFPPKFKNAYRHWMENIKDWCISRQLWWGHQIPAYYTQDGRWVVAKSLAEAEVKVKEMYPEYDGTLTQDPDVLDTWFSSWLWPIAVFDGFYSEDEVSYYYPTTDLVTAPEIMFFWVARMIIAGYEYRNELPFKNVYYTGIVRDKQGRKMSKSLGNSPDPLVLIDQYGADGVRVGMLLSSPAGNDLLFDESLCEQGRNFANKIWNAFRLVKGWEENVSEMPQRPAAQVAVSWMNAQLNATIEKLNDDYEKFRINEALMTTYKLIWDDFCAWYLEMVKPPYGEKMDAITYAATLDIFEKLLTVLHPFMPFLSEEIWHLLRAREEGSSLCVTQWPEKQTSDEKWTSGFEEFSQVVIGIRNVRKENQIANKEKLTLKMLRSQGEAGSFHAAVEHLGNIEVTEWVDEKPDQCYSFIVAGREYFVPFTAQFDAAAEIKKLTEELNYTQGFLASVEKKLSNESFVSKAPAAVLDGERKKQSDAMGKIEMLKQQIAALTK